MQRDNNGLYLKVLTSRGHKGPYSDFEYTKWLPEDEDNIPGPWLPKVSCIKVCEKGYHVTNRVFYDHWYNVQSSEMYVVQCRGNSIIWPLGDKAVFEEMRFITKVNLKYVAGLCGYPTIGAQISEARRKAFRILRNERKLLNTG